MSEESQREFLDRSLRDLLAKPENLRDFLESAVPALAPHFDFDRMRPAPQEFLVGNWRRRKPDLIFEIPYRTKTLETWALVCVLLEPQARADWQVPLKTFVYTALYWEWQWRQWEERPAPKERIQLTPVLPIVLYTTDAPWGSARSLRDLLGPPDIFHDFAPIWTPVIWELAAHDTEELLNAAGAFTQVMSMLKVDGAELAEAERVFGEVCRRLGPLVEARPVRWHDLLQFVMGWVQNRRPREERGRWHTLAVEVQTTPKGRQAMETAMMTIADELRQEGQLLSSRRTVLRLASRRLGAPDEVISARIERIQDLALLEEMIDRSFTATSWQELLESP